MSRNWKVIDVHTLSHFDIIALTTLAIVLYKLLPITWRKLSGLPGNSPFFTALKGPTNKNFFFGAYKLLNDAEDPAKIYEDWASDYGPAFRIPVGFGSSRVVICDPKATAHFYSRETYGYHQPKLSKAFIENLFGRGLLWAEGDVHRRQRRALMPAFSNAVIRRLTPIFYDSAYKTKVAWDSILETDSDALIDVQIWMNRIALDSLGIAGFSHNFKTLDGHRPAVAEVFDLFAGRETSSSPLSYIIFLLGPIMPFLLYLPTEHNRMVARWKKAMLAIVDDLFANLKEEKEKEGAVAGNERIEEKSIIGMLLRAESTGVSQDEILAQNILLLAGYETSSITLTWALIELARHPEIQCRLREELPVLASQDPTWEQLTSTLPYLDALVHEVLRLHPPLTETVRVAAEDDVLPLSTPLTTANGDIVTSLAIPKGTTLVSPTHYMNRSSAFWGPDSKVFRPERWLEAEVNGWGALKAKDIQGHKHLLSFSDGPRICLGRHMGIVEIKAVLAVMIRNYIFELPDGPSTKIAVHRSILRRPKVAGETEVRVPLRIRRVE